MGVSVSNILASTGDDPRKVLAGWLDDYAAKRCDRDDVKEIFISVTRGNADAPWVALALLDQYQRLKRIDPEFAHELNSTVKQVVFGKAQPPLSGLGELSPDKHSTEPEGPTQRHDVKAEPVITRPPIGAIKSNHPSAEMLVTESTPAATLQVEETSQPVESAVISARRVLRQRYELVELIDSNISGALYRALDRQREHVPHEARYVSLKLVSLDEDDLIASPSDILNGFYRAQSLAHPNIQGVFDIGRDDHTCFAVLESLHGEKLSRLLQHLEGRAMPWRYARNILHFIGAALIYAHDRDVVHGNLQPENILITQSGEVKLTDFGFIALHRREPWISDAEPPVAVRNTSSLYSASHQIGQTAHPSDDVFRLACLAYELISGRHPYDGRPISLAKQQGYRPSRRARFNQRQWRVLQRALSPLRDDTNISARELLAGLGCDQAPKRLIPPETLFAERSSMLMWTKTVPLIAASLLLAMLLAYFFAFLPLEKSRPQENANKQQTSSAPISNAMISDKAIDSTTMAESADLPTVTLESSLSAASSTADDATPAGINSASPALTTEGASSEFPSISAERHMPGVSTATESNTKSSGSAATIGSVAFSKDSYVASEGEGAARVVIRRRGMLNKTVRVGWSLSGESAQPGTDYADVDSRIVEIPPGVREYTLVIPLASDAIRENTEMFTVKLYRFDDGPEVLPPTTATVIVVDDD